MPELESIEGWSRGTRGRLRGPSLWLVLLDRLGLVSWALLVVALSNTLSSVVLTTPLTITLLLFKGWLIWAAFDRAELVGIMRGSLFALPLFPDQGHSSSDLGEVQIHYIFFLAHDLGDVIHRWRELHHDDHGLEVLRDVKTCSDYTGKMGNRFVNAEGGVFMV